MTEIPVSRLKEGYESAIENAERLLKAAQILNEHSCYASSIQLSLLSCEESGKAYMILEHWSDGKAITKDQWKSKRKFMGHWKKLFMAEKVSRESFDRKIRERVRKHGADSWASFLGIGPHEYTVIWMARKLKQSLTYLDYDFKMRRWSKPSDSELADVGWANGHVSRAQEFIEAVRQEGKRLGV